MRFLLVLAAVAVFVCGCGRTEMEEKAKAAADKAGQIIGQGAGAFFSGVGEGVEKTVTSYDVRVSDGLQKLGVSVTVAKHTSDSAVDGKPHTLSFYVINKAAFTGLLRIRLLTDKGLEIGRSTARVAFAKDDARYVPFPLEKEVPLALTDHVELDTRAD